MNYGGNSGAECRCASRAGAAGGAGTRAFQGARPQSQRARERALAALARSQFVVLDGYLNDTPDGGPLQSLLADCFHDIIAHADCPTDRPGTYKREFPSGKIDFLISSTALWATVQTFGIERRGSYHPGVREPFEMVTGANDEASDHHCVWMEMEVIRGHEWVIAWTPCSTHDRHEVVQVGRRTDGRGTVETYDDMDFFVWLGLVNGQGCAGRRSMS